MERTNQDAAHEIKEIIVNSNISKNDKIELLEFLESWYNATEYEFGFRDNSGRLEYNFANIE